MENGKIVGFLLATPHNTALESIKVTNPERRLIKEDKNRYYINWVVVLPECQGKGLCSELLLNLFEKLSKIGIYRISVHSRVSSGLSEIINKKLVVTEKRSIDQKKYNEGIQPTDYIEASFKINEDNNLFKPASGEDEQNRQFAKQATLGPRFQQLKKLVEEAKELEKEYVHLTEETYRPHGRDLNSRNYYGPGNCWISYNIKVHPWNRTGLSDICQSHGLEETLWEYKADQYKFTLEDFVGEKKSYFRNKETGRTEEKSYSTGGGLLVDYPDLFDEWEQTGSQGGYLSLHLKDHGWEDLDRIFGNVGSNNDYDLDELDEDLEFITNFIPKANKQLQDIQAVESDVRKTVASCKKYMESVEFGDDFFESMGDDEEYFAARKEWEASKNKVLSTKKVR